MENQLIWGLCKSSFYAISIHFLEGKCFDKFENHEFGVIFFEILSVCFF